MKKVKERIQDGEGGFEVIYEDCETVDILGTEYVIIVRKYSEDEYFKRAECSGYCSGTEKEIVICDMSTYPDWENETKKVIETQTKSLLRHEIIHAFFNESGLAQNSNSVDAWARNEEMIDWFAIQGPKIWKAWQEAGAV